MIFLLECQHVKHTSDDATEFVGQETLCPRCWKMRTILDIDAEFRVRCRTCRYGRRFGAAELAAAYAVDTHRRKYPRHVVSLMLGEKIIRTSVPDTERTQPTLPFPEPPF